MSVLASEDVLMVRMGFLLVRTLCLGFNLTFFFFQCKHVLAVRLADSLYKFSSRNTGADELAHIITRQTSWVK